jgi:hypothetical protein
MAPDLTWAQHELISRKTERNWTYLRTFARRQKYGALWRRNCPSDTAEPYGKIAAGRRGERSACAHNRMDVSTVRVRVARTHHLLVV